MFRLRYLALVHARLMLLLLALSFAAKALVPAGFMLSPGSERFLTVTICADASGTRKQMQISIPNKNDAGGEHAEEGAKGQPCVFSGLGYSALSGSDPVLLAGALAFILLIGLAPLPAPALRGTPFLRPQLRGPPLPSV